MSVELHGPWWAWVLVGLYLVFVSPFLYGIAVAMYEDYKLGYYHRRRTDDE